MAGFYDDRQQRYLPRDDWENGQWLSSEDGRLYIIPVDGDGVEGPDDQIANALLNQLTGRDAISEGEASQLDLSIVPDFLKRFDSAIGYFSA